MIPVLVKQRQEDQRFKASLRYIVSLTLPLSLKKKKKKGSKFKYIKNKNTEIGSFISVLVECEGKVFIVLDSLDIKRSCIITDLQCVIENCYE